MSAEVRRGLVGSLLDSRRTCAWLAGAAVIHMGLELAGLGGWPCPIRAATGVACPGCGLGRACAALLRGDWADAWRLHAFAPVAVGAVVLFAGAAGNDAIRQRARDGIARIEARVPVAAWVLGALIIYWLARLALDAAGRGPLFG